MPSKVEENDNPAVISSAILFIMGWLLLNEIILNHLSKLRSRFGYLKYLNHTIVTTTVGLIAGTILRTFSEESVISEYKTGFSDIFLIILLPPILFESAINMEKVLFFQNFGTILMYAIFGTTIATIVCSLLIYLAGIIGIATSLNLTACFAFGSLISATDLVSVFATFKELNLDRLLYILLFGESILNDAISFIFYETTVQAHTANSTVVAFLAVFLGSILIGVAIGFGCAYLLKNKDRQSASTIQNIEETVTLIVPWVSYLIAQAATLSGIVSIISCGITMARYALPNLTESGMRTMNRLYHTLSYCFENSVFIFIGIGIVSIDLSWSKMGPGLFIMTLFAIYFSRFCNIRIISYLVNLTRREHIITDQSQFVLWFSGLRGGMSYALALRGLNIFEESGEIMLTMSLVIVIIDIYVQGFMILPVLERIDYIFPMMQLPKQDLQKDESRIKRTGCFQKIKQCLAQCDDKLLQLLIIPQQQVLQQPEIEEQIQLNNS